MTQQSSSSSASITVGDVTIPTEIRSLPVTDEVVPSVVEG